MEKLLRNNCFILSRLVKEDASPVTMLQMLFNFLVRAIESAAQFRWGGGGGTGSTCCFNFGAAVSIDSLRGMQLALV